MGGTLEYISGILGSGHKHKKKKKKQLQTVELKVRMDCDGCELKVKNALSSMKGVQSVDINKKQQKVTVTGYVEANKVLKKAKSTGKKAEIWPYVPYNLVSHPYIAQAYDKKAPLDMLGILSLRPSQALHTNKKIRSLACSVMTTLTHALSCEVGSFKSLFVCFFLNLLYPFMSRFLMRSHMTKGFKGKKRRGCLSLGRSYLNVILCLNFYGFIYLFISSLFFFVCGGRGVVLRGFED
ncbi:Heavy metal-associated isoprenylated plant protein 26 [Acorus calamus]|uniref:Heavy metal-associated isoprenylated plant protein 26 n=1 Tax=Acorus calamus TaxID=4465 RepID=A0AAV9E5M5_ACOCL|nr:Heavy metal-associated isoprenylated plant protein 26 [Acorus calamus]